MQQQLEQAKGEAKGYEKNWRLALKERDEAREQVIWDASYINDLLAQIAELKGKND